MLTESKDRVLAVLCASAQLEALIGFSTKEIMQESNTELNILQGTLNYFERIGFISHLNFRNETCHFCLHLEALECHEKGGFTMAEKHILLTIQKLELEIRNFQQQLEPRHLEKAGQISGIIGTLQSLIVQAMPYLSL